MAATTKYFLAPAATTGNNATGTPVIPPNGFNDPVAIQFVVEVAGGTPTITWKAQGSVDGTNWYDLWYVTNATNTGAATALTATAVGGQIIWMDVAGGGRSYTQFRLVTSANTNITYRCELYAFENV